MTPRPTAWLIALLLTAPAAGAEPALEFQVAGKTESRFTLSQLKSRLPERRVEFVHPFLDGKKKFYEGFELRELLALAYGERWKSEEFSDAAFIALDGYEAMGPLEKLRESGALMAFRDLDRDFGWEPVGHKKADPGPFFLIWTSTAQSTEKAYPWPWQLAAINLIRFEDQYPAVVPRGAAANSAEMRGFATFRARCLRCHSMNSEGGKIGPDLNAPQSVTAYRPKRMIKEFIRNPSKYRHTQMPDHPDLDDDALEALYRYFKHQAKHSKPIW